MLQEMFLTKILQVFLFTPFKLRVTLWSQFFKWTFFLNYVADPNPHKELFAIIFL